LVPIVAKSNETYQVIPIICWETAERLLENILNFL
jgi:hypothetical protein